MDCRSQFHAGPTEKCAWMRGWWGQRRGLGQPHPGLSPTTGGPGPEALCQALPRKVAQGSGRQGRGRGSCRLCGHGVRAPRDLQSQLLVSRVSVAGPLSPGAGDGWEVQAAP